jgi:excisionase family DNA binding protein
MTPHAGIRGTHAGKDLPLLSTVDETAALLRTTRKAIYSMIERGQLPGVTRIGRRVLIRTPDLLDWLRQKSTPSLER